MFLTWPMRWHFYPRSPCGERPAPPTEQVETYIDFYPRSPCGDRRNPEKRCKRTTVFLSTLSLRRATTRGQSTPVSITYFYPRSPCGERPPAGKVRPWASHISIHALLAESDEIYAKDEHGRYISIHALLAESDRCDAKKDQLFA